MNFFDAINSHVAWKVHLQNHLLGIADAAFDAHGAGEIVRLHGAGRTAEAEHLLHHGYAAHSRRLVQRLRALSRLIDGAGT